MQVKGSKDTIDWYNKNAGKYAESIAEYSSPELLDKFKQLVGEGKVLDAGCGAGRDTKLLNIAGLEAIGLDISEGLISEARRRFPKLTFIQDSFLEIPQENESFSGVWAHASLLHLETPDDVSRALSEFSRVLKSDGILHVMVKAQTGEDKTAVVSDALSEHDRFFQYFTQEEISGLIEKAGFEIISSEQFKESDRNPKGRPEVEWVVVFARKRV